MRLSRSTASDDFGRGDAFSRAKWREGGFGVVGVRLVEWLSGCKGRLGSGRMLSRRSRWSRVVRLG